jgi:hypothetical protein
MKMVWTWKRASSAQATSSSAVNALVALLDGSVDEEVLRGGTHEAVDHVDGRGERAAVLLAHAVKRRHGTVVRAGDAAREGKVNRGDAGGDGLLERLLVDHLGGLRGHGAGAVLDGGVEVVGRAGLEEVVDAGEAAVGLACLGIGEREARDARLLDLLGGKVAARVRHDVALGRHVVSSVALVVRVVL